MSPVHKLSQIGSLTGNKTDYPSMLAGYGDFGALQRIGWVTVTGSPAGLFQFTNIPQNFQDLMIVVSARDTASASTAVSYWYVNNQQGTSNYSDTRLTGDGSSATSDRISNNSFFNPTVSPAASATSGIFGSWTCHILNYANSSTFKTMLSRSASDLNGSGITRLNASLWRQTTAITSLQIYGLTSWAVGSTAALYGVKASAA